MTVTVTAVFGELVCVPPPPENEFTIETEKLASDERASEVSAGGTVPSDSGGTCGTGCGFPFSVVSAKVVNTENDSVHEVMHAVVSGAETLL